MGLPTYQVMEVIDVGLAPSLRNDDVPVLHVSISMTSGARVHRPWFLGNISASKKLSKRELVVQRKQIIAPVPVGDVVGN